MFDLPGFLVGAAAFLFGLIVGSFLNVVIYRLPIGESIVLPASHCPSCNSKIRPYDNVPVLSYLVLGGRCRQCRTRISPLYPMVELTTAILFLLVFIKDGLTVKAAVEVVFTSLIIPLVFIDLRYKILPNAITYPGLAAMMFLRVIEPDQVIVASLRSSFGLVDWPDYAVSLLGAALGAIVGGGSLWLVRSAYYLVRRVEGMGLGDVKMMLMVGAFLGWERTMLTIFLATLFGSIVGLTLIRLKGGSMKMEIPFGVFLGPAALASMFLGHELIAWYLTMYR